MAPRIVNDRIEGSRITVWDITHYLERGRSVEEITGILPVTRAEVEAAVAYIDAHHDDVMRVHREIEARVSRGNPPDIASLTEDCARRFHDRLETRTAARGLTK